MVTLSKEDYQVQADARDTSDVAMKTVCVVCQQELVAVVMFKNKDDLSVGWIDTPATMVTTLVPTAEEVTKLSCHSCGILYDHEI